MNNNFFYYPIIEIGSTSITTKRQLRTNTAVLKELAHQITIKYWPNLNSFFHNLTYASVYTDKTTPCQLQFFFLQQGTTTDKNPNAKIKPIIM